MSAERSTGDAGAGVHGQTIRFAGIGDEAGDSLQEQLDSLGRLDWRSIELRSIDGVAVADLGQRAFGRLLATLSAHDADVVCVASQIGNWSRPITGEFARDLDELAILASRCGALGTRYVRVMSYRNDGLDEREWGRRAVERLRQLTSRAEQAGLVLVHENCTGWASIEAERMLHLLDAVGSPALGLLFDTGNGLAYGYDAHDLLVDIVGHVRHVHVKDVRGSRDAPQYTPPGDGCARIAACLRLLLTSGYTGAWSIEPHVVVRPHEQASGAMHRASRRSDGFHACGLALEDLVCREVLAEVPPWTLAPGGILRGP